MSQDLKPCCTIILAGAGICSVIVAGIVGSTVKHLVDAFTK